ncbi:MAG: tetratricopeptide repeat protein, partial [Candidatus Omnitrophota bacterium]
QRELFKNRILLHIDAHINFGWIPERSSGDLLQVSSLRELETLIQKKNSWNFSGRKLDTFVHIGNYICLALREGIVRAFYWVTPEAPPGVSWEHQMLRLFQGLQKSHPDVFSDIVIEENKGQANVYGFPLIVSTFRNLPSIDEELLLDIDTDFLISGFLEKGEDPRRKKPWLFPEELVGSLREKKIRSDCVTIAYSVEGGFTPLRYKYLGDRLAQLMREPFSDTPSYDFKRNAQALEEKGEIEKAVSDYQKALTLNPKDVASLYNLSCLFLERGEKEEASGLYQQAISADPTYATAYNNFGPVYQNLGQWKKAREEYEKTLLLDPDDPHVLCGLGDVSRAQRDWKQTQSYYEKALLKNPELSSAFYGLGTVFFERKEWERALDAFQRALVLKGPEGSLNLWIGLTLFKQKAFRRAKEMLLDAARLGFHSPDLHAALFWIYFREGLCYKMARELRKLLYLFWIRLKSQMSRLLSNV